jgi:hypothetical protein
MTAKATPRLTEGGFIVIHAIARAICQSRSCEGVRCCQWPANGARRSDCPVDRGGYDDAARAALAALHDAAMTT